jgi:hypothetical protein
MRGEGKKKCTLVELLEALKLRSKPALAGSVDDEHNLALELGQIVDTTLLCRQTVSLCFLHSQTQIMSTSKRKETYYQGA